MTSNRSSGQSVRPGRGARTSTPAGAPVLDDAAARQLLHDARQPLTALRLDLGGATFLLRRDEPAVAEALAAIADSLREVERLQDHLERLDAMITVVGRKSR